MQFDLESEVDRETLSERIRLDIDNYCADAYDDGNRNHLGASLIAHSCSYYLWLTFRWAHQEKYGENNEHKGRMMRLFNRGHLEEKRWIEWLRATGWTVRELDEETQKQIRIYFADGHGGGSLDAEISHPIYTNNENVLGEFKTFGTKPFSKLVNDGGVRMQKPQHWGQMCCYGYARKIRYAVYFPINKNDDDIRPAVVKLDLRLGEELLRKGEMIVYSKTPPQKLSENPAFFDCKYCGQFPVCHGEQPVDKNCRSCRHSEPRPGGVWFCTKFGGDIPADFIPKGCAEHFSITGQ